MIAVLQDPVAQRAFSGLPELSAAVFQLVVTLGLALLCAELHRIYRKPVYAWWAVAWLLYVLRITAIVGFLIYREWIALYWHQVLTGWVALALLGAATVFVKGRIQPWFAVAAAFPPLWAYIAIYELNPLTAAAMMPAVAFLAGASFLTGVVFWRHAQRTKSLGATALAIAFLLWGLHHVDYPIFRARGGLGPWNYYLDVLFEVAVATGILMLVVDDLTEKIRQRSEELERLSARMVRQHEDERRRLSRELHDETAQVLGALKLELGALRNKLPDADQGRADDAMTLVDAGIRSIRAVTNELRPALLDDLGLIPALRSLVTEFASRTGIAAQFESRGGPATLSHDAELALFRALQEGLANAARHAAPKTVEVRLTYDAPRLVLTIADDGVGMNPEHQDHSSMGLTGMRERVAGVGGTLQVVSHRGEGTRLQVSLTAGAAP